MKRSMLVMAVLLLALIMSVSVCGAAKKYVIGFSQLGAESGWRDAETESVKSAAVQMGINLKFSDGQQKQENQIKAIRAFIAQKVDGILLTPVVESGWDDVLKEAKDAKIPVVLLDRGIDTKDNSLYVCNILTQFRAAAIPHSEHARFWVYRRCGPLPERLHPCRTPHPAAGRTSCAIDPRAAPTVRP